LGVEDDQGAAVLGGEVDHGEQPSVVLGGGGASGHEDRFTDYVAGLEVVLGA
jgi:hypothetical protein